MKFAPVFQFEASASGDLRAKGVISFANAAQALAQDTQLARVDGKVNVDIGGLENPDSATLAVLIAWAASARRRRVSLRYLRTPQGLLNLARLCEVEGLLGLD